MFGSSVQLGVAVAGIYSCYLLYSIVQEKIATKAYDGERFQFTLFLLLVQCSLSVASSGVVMAFLRKGQPASGFQKFSAHPKTRGVPFLEYARVSFFYISAMLCSNTALYYISYPNQVIIKSCKLVPVMAMNVLWRGKRYPVGDYLRVLAITLGVLVFTFQQNHTASTSSMPLLGLGLGILSLLLDGVVGPSQDKIAEEHLASELQMMFFTNLWATVLCAIAALLKGEVLAAITFLVRHPEGVRDIALFSVTSAAGQFFIFYTVRHFSALVLVTITTTRKFFTVLASVLVGADGSGHALTTAQWLAVVLVFCGLGWDQIAKLGRRHDG